MKTLLAITFAAIPLALAGCARQHPSDRPAVAPAAKIVGNAEDCVSINQLGESRIRDDGTIDFIRIGNRAWRNTLPQSCPGLKSVRDLIADADQPRGFVLVACQQGHQDCDGGHKPRQIEANGFGHGLARIWTDFTPISTSSAITALAISAPRRSTRS